MSNAFESIKSIWTETGVIFKVVLAGFIIAMIVAVVAGTHEDERRTTRTNFCLERGYDGFKIGMRNDGDKFYCWNTVNGEIKRFRDPYND